ncbi:MAG: hypothetical protein AB7O78_01130 [Thermoleophilia bacterium]
MTRITRALVLIIALAATASPAAASWTTVSGLVPGTATSASLDGPRVLVSSLANGRRVQLTTIVGDRVAKRQTLTTAGRSGTVRHLQVARLRGGRALAIWQEPGVVKASLRRSAGVPFSPAVTVSRFPGVATGAAIRPVLTVTPTGEAVVVWIGGPAGGRLGIQASSLAPGTTSWSAPVDVAGGALPQISGVGLGAPLPLSAATDNAGGVVVAWGAPASDPARSSLDIVGAVRSPDGAWGTPVRVGAGGPPLAVAATAPGDAVAAWQDGACVAAATLRGVAVTPATVSCHPGASVGQLALSRTPYGNAILAAEFIPQPFPTAGAPFVETAARSIGGGPWSAPIVPIALPADLGGIAQGSAFRTAVAATVARGAQFNGVRVVILNEQGTLLRRIGGPAMPTPPRNTSVRVLPLGPGARVALLLTPEPTLTSSRLSILTLEP